MSDRVGDLWKMPSASLLAARESARWEDGQCHQGKRCQSVVACRSCVVDFCQRGGLQAFIVWTLQWLNELWLYSSCGVWLTSLLVEAGAWLGHTVRYKRQRFGVCWGVSGDLLLPVDGSITLRVLSPCVTPLSQILQHSKHLLCNTVDP